MARVRPPSAHCACMRMMVCSEKKAPSSTRAPPKSLAPRVLVCLRSCMCMYAHGACVRACVCIVRAHSRAVDLGDAEGREAGAGM